jgi:hypothetical protein
MEGLKEFLSKQSELNVVTFERIGKPFVVNPFTLADLAWKDAQFKPEEILEAFKTLDMNVLGRIFYRILDNESKKLLAACKIIEVDEKGEEIEIRCDFVYEKLRYLISGERELALFLRALMLARNISIPEGKASEGRDPKKSLVGEKSSTLSPTNTDTPPKTLET